jgi:hypothetical protein
MEAIRARQEIARARWTAPELAGEAPVGSGNIRGDLVNFDRLAAFSAALQAGTG